ncbi:hypothetical protein [Neobacillus sp. FSL H8-0543]|uniref:hypothetical protein n=1 Tax=Neobacillus sp. FSL H8-0543 TaxID=2954672 RepID=UPI003158BAAA
MASSIFSKKKDIENLSFFGVADLLGLVVNLVFSFSTVKIKRVLLFSLGLLLAGFFLYILITGKY